MLMPVTSRTTLKRSISILLRFLAMVTLPLLPPSNLYHSMASRPIPASPDLFRLRYNGQEDALQILDNGLELV